MLFVKYISDVWQDQYDKHLKDSGDDHEYAARRMRYERFVLPEGSDYYSLYDQRNADNVGELINIALDAIEDANKEKLESVFRNIDFNSEANLGRTRQRNERLKNLLEDFADPRLDMRPTRIGDRDVIGDAYEYLIGKFAAGAGKKAGEFYTPPEVSRLLATLLDPQPGDRICDPACGSGSLLIKCGAGGRWPRLRALRAGEQRQHVGTGDDDMFLHDVNAPTIHWGDTLKNPQLLEGDHLMRFNVVVANPPFSLDKWGKNGRRTTSTNASGAACRPRARAITPS